MQKKITFTHKFEKDMKKISSSGNHKISALNEVVTLLCNNKPLDAKYKDHQLIGNWSGYRECHIKPDWLLIYEMDNHSVTLHRTGSHSDLF